MACQIEAAVTQKRYKEGQVLCEISRITRAYGMLHWRQGLRNTTVCSAILLSGIGCSELGVEAMRWQSLGACGVGELAWPPMCSWPEHRMLNDRLYYSGSLYIVMGLMTRNLSQHSTSRSCRQNCLDMSSES